MSKSIERQLQHQLGLPPGDPVHPLGKPARYRTEPGDPVPERKQEDVVVTFQRIEQERHVLQDRICFLERENDRLREDLATSLRDLAITRKAYTELLAKKCASRLSTILQEIRTRPVRKGKK
jgi:hypothetical protein